jgi:DNA-binding beta-propeller fold protein YncE
VANIRVGLQPGAGALTPDESLLLVVHAGSNDMAVVRPAARALSTLLPVGLRPQGVAVKVLPLESTGGSGGTSAGDVLDSQPDAK